MFNKIIRSLLVLALALSGLVLAEEPAQPSAQQKLATMAGKATGLVIYIGAKIIPGNKSPVLSDMAIVVDGERIRAIVPLMQLSHAATDGAEIVDMQGMYVLPGLIDSHVHYGTHPNRSFAEPQLKRDLYAGITAVRDMAGDARFLGDLSRAALINEIPAPDIFYASLVAGPTFFDDPCSLLSVRFAGFRHARNFRLEISCTSAEMT